MQTLLYAAYPTETVLCLQGLDGEFMFYRLLESSSVCCSPSRIASVISWSRLPALELQPPVGVSSRRLHARMESMERIRKKAPKSCNQGDRLWAGYP